MFTNFPLILNKFDNEDERLMVDMFHKLEFFKTFLDTNPSYFKEYLISDHETQEGISMKVYKSKKYWYLIMLINGLYDPFFDWVLTNDEVMEYAIKFVTENVSDVQKYLSSHGSILENISKDVGYTISTYNPSDPTDVNDFLVKHMIDHYYTIMVRENNEKRMIYLPDTGIMTELYQTYERMSNEF